MDKVAELGIAFRLVPVIGQFHVTASKFELRVEANVIGTDDVVADRRHSWTFGYVQQTKGGVFLHFELNSPRHRRMRVYTEFRSRSARMAIRKVEDRLASIVAPKHYVEIRRLDAAIEMFEEVHKQMAVYAVMET